MANPSAIARWKWAIDNRQWLMGNRQWMENGQSVIAIAKLRITDCQIAHWQITHQPLSIAHQPLPIADCRCPSSNWRVFAIANYRFPIADNRAWDK
jgi:hypothetical protein